VFWVISVYFNIRNTLPKYGTFLLGHPVYIPVQGNVFVAYAPGEGKELARGGTGFASCLAGWVFRSLSSRRGAGAEVST
jgi:hypothetical protein